ncbi:MAG: hypothetical protein U5K74_02420 [Gemmatimonadaceae bacterium]|nr:hypothetical protein [Gemmatimonadaceae bacterium]
MAVIPPNGQRLEMHHIVAYRNNTVINYSIHPTMSADVPMQPWQTMIMAKSTIADENLAMKPRMGMMLGCPYGQEAELPKSGIIFTGQNFGQWRNRSRDSISNAVLFHSAREAWTQFLKEGVMRRADRCRQSKRLKRTGGIPQDGMKSNGDEWQCFLHIAYSRVSECVKAGFPTD